MQPSFTRRGFALLKSGFDQPLVGLPQHFCLCLQREDPLQCGRGPLHCGGSGSSTFSFPQTPSCFQCCSWASQLSWGLRGRDPSSPPGKGEPSKGVLGILQHLSCGDTATAKPLCIKPSATSSAFGVFQLLPCSLLCKHELSIRTALFCKDTEH